MKQSRSHKVARWVLVFSILLSPVMLIGNAEAKSKGSLKRILAQKEKKARKKAKRRDSWITGFEEFRIRFAQVRCIRKEYRRHRRNGPKSSVRYLKRALVRELRTIAQLKKIDRRYTFRGVWEVRRDLDDSLVGFFHFPEPNKKDVIRAEIRNTLTGAPIKTIAALKSFARVIFDYDFDFSYKGVAKIRGSSRNEFDGFYQGEAIYGVRRLGP